jgi:hypothetical protein
MNADEIIKGLFGDSISNISINMININSSSKEGTNDGKFPSCNDFIKACNEYHLSLLTKLNSEKEKSKETDPLEFADKLFTPIWLSPSSMKSRTHPLDFDGNHVTEKATQKIGTYSTKQVVVNYDASDICAALASKIKFYSEEGKKPELLVPEEGYTVKQVDRSIERGMCNSVGLKTTDFIRYITRYKRGDGKTVVSLICGDYQFLSGSLDIFKRMFTLVDVIKSSQRNKKRNGVDLSDKNISIAAKEDDVYDAASVSFARLMGGAIFLHDHLCVLRDIYGVKKLLAFDTSSEKKSNPIPIQTVIDDYSRIKKYYTLLNSLKMIS